MKELKENKLSDSKNILITGASGFLGSIVKEAFLKKNFNVYSVSRKNKVATANHFCTDLSSVIPDFENRHFTKVVHIAGKAHSVPKTREEEDQFFITNQQGTLNLLAGLEKLTKKPGSVIFTSTVAVYGKEEGRGITENEEIAGSNPYAKSKIEAEKAIVRWCIEHSVNYYIFRLPLIAGTDPPGNLGALKSAIYNRKYIRISNNEARKSVVLASDIAELILNLQNNSGIYNLTDGDHPKFYEIENAIEKRLGKKIILSLPLIIMQIVAGVGDIFCKIRIPFPLTSDRLKKMTATLTFSDVKARTELNWNPKPVIPFIEKYI